MHSISIGALSSQSMHASNSFVVERHADHFILRFQLSTGVGEATTREDVVSLFLPLTAATGLAVTLFEQFQLATPELQRFFEELAPRIAAINANAERIKIAEQAKDSGT